MDEAKSARSVAKRAFIISIKEFNKAVEQKALMNIMTKRFEGVSQSWSEVVSKHATFLATKYPEDDEIPDTEE